MPYTAEISRGNPTCFVFMIDQSGSMNDAFGTENALRKADFAADVVNRAVHDLVIRCTRTEEIRNYYYVSVIGYGGTVGPGFGGGLSGRTLIPISEVGETPARLEDRTKKVPDGAGGLVETQVRFPIWMDALSGGGTPMCQAFGVVRDLLDQWLPEHKHGFPPTVLHLTDGESTDGDPSQIGHEILSRRSNDGEVLLFNCHVSSRHSLKIEYPSDDSGLPDDFAKMLFNISSRLLLIRLFQLPTRPSVMGWHAQHFQKRCVNFSRISPPKKLVKNIWPPAAGRMVLCVLDAGIGVLMN